MKYVHINDLPNGLYKKANIVILVCITVISFVPCVFIGMTIKIAKAVYRELKDYSPKKEIVTMVGLFHKMWN